MSKNQTSFSERLKSRNKNSQGAPTVIEAENDFPITLDFVRVGSAHQVAINTSQEQANVDLLAKIMKHVMERFEPNKKPSPIVVENK
jgi:hypothetical protein